MRLDKRPLARDRRGLHVGDGLYRVGIPHGEDGDLDRATRDLERPAHSRLSCRQASRIERHAPRIELRGAHVDAHLAVALQAWGDDSGKGFDANFGLLRESLVVHEPDEAARTVAALLDLPAVGVPDAIAEIGAFSPWPLDQQHLVAADPEVAVGDPLCQPGRHFDGAAHPVQDDEVIARALHLAELQLQYHLASPGGRVLKRLCVQKYCSGISRTRSSMNSFMRRASTASSPLGKSSHAGWQCTSYPSPPGNMRVTTGNTRAPVTRAMRESPVTVAAATPKKGTKMDSRAP